ncbi:MAG TPA: tyrosine-type recombinase/integrase [Acidimicrobiales bacterium]|nr:tyrosine-type recombinase/integrase [Acidimicrobiales bacterium]
MTPRRSNHEGSIYQRKSDGLWLGVAHVGYDAMGKPLRKYVSAKKRTEVVEKLKDLRRKIDDRLLLKDESVKVAELFERWFEDVMRHQIAPSTFSNYQTVVRMHILPCLGNKKLVELNVGDVDKLLSQKADSGLSASTVRRIRAVLAQCLDQAIRWELVHRNVATLSRSPKMVRREGRTLSPDQARHLLETLRGHHNEALYAQMLSTGLRRGEALGLRWSDFDRDTGVLRVLRQLKREGSRLVTTDTKTSLSRRAVNLPEPMLKALLTHEERQEAERDWLGDSWIDSGYIFTSSVGTPIDPRNLYREFQAICRSAGLGDWHPHELRHSAASLMLAQGVKIQVVSQVLGHSSIRMTADVYGHILDPDRREAADAMGSMLWDGSASGGDSG